MDLNTKRQHFCFIVGSELIPTKCDGKQVSREGWAQIISVVKADCKGMLEVSSFIF